MRSGLKCPVGATRTTRVFDASGLPRGALLIGGPRRLGSGSAVHRKERCTASGTRGAVTSPTALRIFTNSPCTNSLPQITLPVLSGCRRPRCR